MARSTSQFCNFFMLAFSPQQVELGWIKVDSTNAFKTVFLGDPNVGKTCLARMFVDRAVLEQSCNTIGFDHHVKQVEVEEGLQVKVRGGLERERGEMERAREGVCVCVFVCLFVCEQGLSVVKWPKHCKRIIIQVHVPCSY